MKAALLLIPLLLAGCAAPARSSDPCPEMWTCDPSGAGWPTEFPRTKIVIVHRVENPSAHDSAKRNLLGFALPTSGPVCRVYVPLAVPAPYADCGYTLEGVLAHEIGHCEGVTVHDLVSPACIPTGPVLLALITDNVFTPQEFFNRGEVR